MEPIESLAALTAGGVVAMFALAAVTARSGWELRDWLRLQTAELLLPACERRVHRTGRHAVGELDRDLAAAALDRFRLDVDREPRSGRAYFVDGFSGPRLHLVVDGAELECQLFRGDGVADVVRGAVQLRLLAFSEGCGWRIVLRCADRLVECHAWRIQFVRPVSPVG